MPESSSKKKNNLLLSHAIPDNKINYEIYYNLWLDKVKEKKLINT
jgi:hypothetical protein